MVSRDGICSTLTPQKGLSYILVSAPKFLDRVVESPDLKGMEMAFLNPCRQEAGRSK